MCAWQRFVAVGDGASQVLLSDVREYIAQGADEAEACGDVETQVVFLVEAVQLNLIEGRPVDVMIVQGNESGGANSQFTTRQLFDLVAPTVDVPVTAKPPSHDRPSADVNTR